MDSFNKIKQDKAIRQQIRVWASLGVSAPEMIELYQRFRNDWEMKRSPDIIVINKTNIVKDLAFNYRYDVLTLFADINPNYLSLKTQKDGYTPLNSAVWNNSEIEYDLQTIIKTIDVLLQKFKLRIFTMSANEDEKNESIFGSIYAENSLIPIDIKNSIYDYLTLNLDYSFYAQEFQQYVNSISTLNVDKLRNKFLFMVMQFPEQTIDIIFGNIFRIETNMKIVGIPKINVIMDIIVNPPNNVDLELARYFETQMERKNGMFIINYIVNNCDIIIEKHVTNMRKNGIECDEGKCYHLMFACFGKLFVKAKELIYNKMKTYRGQSWFMNAILYFIFFSEIDLNKFILNIKNKKTHYFTSFFSKYLKEYYFNDDAKMQTKILIENVISMKIDRKLNSNGMMEFIIE